MIKNIGEQPDEDIHRMSPGRVPSTGASNPTELWYVTLHVPGCVHLPVCSPTIGDFMEASSGRIGQLLTQFPSPISGGLGGGGGEGMHG